jgi:hypothetical protein
MRRIHLAGAVGAAVLSRCLELGWARRAKGSRVVSFSAVGEKAFRACFSLPEVHGLAANDRLQGDAPQAAHA